MPGLAAALRHDDSLVREAAAGTLKRAAEKGTDISIALPQLVRLVLEDNPSAREYARRSVWIVMERGDQETRNSIISYIDDFVKSGLFMTEAEKNSRGYVRAVQDLNVLVRRIQELERAA